MLAMELDECFTMYHGFKDNVWKLKKVLHQLIFLPLLYPNF